jgi:uroporphyrinogen-III synthase
VTRVVVTGTDGRLAERLLAEGFDVVECPLVRIEPLSGPPIEAGDYDWVLVTSRNAVAPLLERLHGTVAQVAAIGPGTAAALRERGVEPALVAEQSTQEGLAAALPRPAGRVLFAGAEGARDVLVHELGAEFVPLYRTVELHPDDFPAADFATLASASAATVLAAIRPGLPCVSIGPVTTEEAQRVGLDVVAEAATHDLDGLVAAVKLARSHGSSSPS